MLIPRTIRGMPYAELVPPNTPPKSYTPMPIRRIKPLSKPPTNITLPRLPTIRSDGQKPKAASDHSDTNPNSPITFYTTPSDAAKKGVRYRLTTHLIPAAYPRSSWLASTPVDTGDYARIVKEEKKDVREKMFEEYRSVLRGWADTVNEMLDDGGGGDGESAPSYESLCATQKRVLWNSVNRIVRDDLDGEENRDSNRTRLTLFLAHANGFPKETWEPAIQSLLRQFEESSDDKASASAPIIEEIWVFEAIQHGDTGLINTGLLPRSYDWSDNVRDILHVLLHYIPEEIERKPNGEAVVLPTHLTRLPETTASHRASKGYSSRTLAAIGHSLGGCSIARAAIEVPALFSSTILVDPVIRVPASSKNFTSGLTEGALKRRSSWKSREEAGASFSRSQFFTSWHPDALNAYIQYAVTEEEGVAKLKMSGLHEAIVFLHLRTGFETWQLIPQLDSRIPLFWIVSGVDATALGGFTSARETVWRRPVNSRNVALPVGHLIPHEVPVEFATLVREFLVGEHSTSIMHGEGGDPQSSSSSLESSNADPGPGSTAPLERQPGLRVKSQL